MDHVKPRPVSAATRRKARRLRDQLDAGHEILAGVILLEDLIARAEEISAADGYPAGSLGGGHGGGIETSTSTESAALRGLPVDGEDDWARHQQLDVVRSTVADLLHHGDLIEASVRRVDECIGYLRHYHEAVKAKASLSGQCRACGRDVEGGSADPWRNGYCGACDKAHMRAGRPADRMPFERVRWLASHPTCDEADELDYRRRLAKLPELDGYRRREVSAAVEIVESASQGA